MTQTFPFDVTLTWGQLLTAAEVGVKRRIMAMMKGRSEPHGTPETELWKNDIEAAAAEYAASIATNVRWRMEIEKNLTPRPPDLGEDIEVRWTIHRERGHLPVYDRDPVEHRYVLVVGEIPTFTVVGMIDGSKAKDPLYRTTSPRGERCFWIPQGALT